MAVVLGLALTAAACGSSTSSSSSGAKASGAVVKIGGDFPLSGVNSAYGPLYEDAVNLAAKVVNQSHVFNGTIKATYADSQALPAPAVTAMHQLVSVDNTVAVLTGISAPSLAIAPIGNETKTLIINGGGATPALANLNPYFYNDIPLGTADVPPMVNYVVKTLKKTRWAVIYSTETEGTDLLAALKKSLAAEGGTLIKAVGVDPTATTFSGEMSQIAAAKPNVLYIASTSGATFPTILNQAAGVGLHALVTSDTGYDLPPVLSDPLSNGNLFVSQYQNLKSTDTVTTEFNQAWKSTYKSAPDSLQINYYNAVLVIADSAAILQKERKSISGANIAAVMRNRTFQVVGGPLTFTASGTLDSPRLQIIRIGAHGSESAVVTTNG